MPRCAKQTEAILGQDPPAHAFACDLILSIHILTTLVYEDGGGREKNSPLGEKYVSQSLYRMAKHFPQKLSP